MSVLDDEQSALEEKSRKRREREDKKIAKQKAAIATDSVPKPPAAAATKAAPVTSGAVHRSAAEVDAIMQKLIDESPSLAEAQIDQIHQFLIGNYGTFTLLCYRMGVYHWLLSMVECVSLVVKQF